MSEIPGLKQDTRFKKGVSGNPLGLPRARGTRAVARATLRMDPESREIAAPLSGCVHMVSQGGRDLRDKMELGLAWKRVAREGAEGTLGGEFDRNDRADLQPKVKDAEVAAKDEVWGDYRFADLGGSQEADGLKVIDLGAGHSSGETLCGRAIAALKSEVLLSLAPATSNAAGRRRSRTPAPGRVRAFGRAFSIGSLARLVDPDPTLKSKIAVRRFVCEGPCLLGIFARLKGGQIFGGREPRNKPSLDGICL